MVAGDKITPPREYDSVVIRNESGAAIDYDTRGKVTGTSSCSVERSLEN